MVMSDRRGGSSGCLSRTSQQDCRPYFSSAAVLPASPAGAADEQVCGRLTAGRSNANLR
jgi:hypothetical protein